MANRNIQRLLISLLCAMLSIMARADNTLSVSTASGVPKSEVEISVSLSNSDAVSGMQLEIPLSSHLEYVVGSATLDSERSNGHGISASLVDNVLKIMVYSLIKAQIKGSNGTLLSFRLRLDAEPGVYTLKPSVTLGETNGNTLGCKVLDGSVTILAPKMKVLTPMVDFQHIPLKAEYTADVTIENSGTVPMSVNSIKFSDDDFSANLTSCVLEANTSRTLTITYVPTKRGHIENTMTIFSDAVNGEQSITIKSDPYAVNELHTVGGEGISDSDVSVTLNMINMDQICGVQCTYQLPEEVEYVKGSAELSGRKTDHTVREYIKDNTLTLFAYSLTSKPFVGNEGPLLSFRLHLVGSSGSYTLHPENVTLATAESINVLSDIGDGTVMIQSPMMDAPDEVKIPAASVESVATGTFDITNKSSLPLTISSATFVDEGFAIVDELPLTIPANTEYKITISYTGDQAGTFSTTMNLYTNDPDQRMKQIRVEASLYESNVISVTQCGGSANSCTFAVSLENYSDISGLQMDFRFEGVDVGNVTLAPGLRLNGFVPTLKKVNDVWRLVIHSFYQGKTISDHQGELFEITCDNVRKTGEEPLLMLENVILSGNETDNSLTVNSPISCNISFGQPIISGDVNGDGKITAQDVTLLTNRTLNKTVPSSFIEAAADLNGDGKITAEDLTILITLTLK